MAGVKFFYVEYIITWKYHKTHKMKLKKRLWVLKMKFCNKKNLHKNKNCSKIKVFTKNQQNER